VFRFFAAQGTNYSLERSSDLKQWQKVSTISGDNTLHQHAEQSTTNEFQYFRLNVAP
jgi:hypothetical protein